jgi:hypothetical protein
MNGELGRIAKEAVEDLGSKSLEEENVDVIFSVDSTRARRRLRRE